LRRKTPGPFPDGSRILITYLDFPNNPVVLKKQGLRQKNPQYVFPQAALRFSSYPLFFTFSSINEKITVNSFTINEYEIKTLFSMIFDNSVQPQIFSFFSQLQSNGYRGVGYCC
jgi:hypothetical protein